MISALVFKKNVTMPWKSLPSSLKNFRKFEEPLISFEVTAMCGLESKRAQLALLSMSL